MIINSIITGVLISFYLENGIFSLILMILHVTH